MVGGGTMVIRQKQMTYEEFDKFTTLPENRERNFELINGEIIEKMPAQVHGRIARTFVAKLSAYFDLNPIGTLEIEVRYRLPDDMLNAVQPDVSVFMDLTTPAVEQGYVPRMPDVAVEIKSPSDTFSLMRDKAAAYLEKGTKLVWLIYSEQRMVEVYAPGVDLKILTERDTLDGGEVLPGFVLAISDIFKTL